MLERPHHLPPAPCVRDNRHWLTGVHFRPTADTLWSIVSYVAVVGALYAAFQVFTTANVAANFITYGIVALALLGVGVPVAYTTLVRRRPLSDLGITTQALLPSLALGVFLGWDTWRNTITMLPGGWADASVVPLVALALSVSLFEAVFFRGWLQLRFEEAFGVIPGLVVAAVLYALYHVGYGMNATEMLFLFTYGLTFGAMFRLTRNVFVLWPFYTPVGSLYNNLKEGLAMPFEATYGFAIVLALVTAIIIGGTVLGRRLRSASADLD